MYLFFRFSSAAGAGGPAHARVPPRGDGRRGGNGGPAPAGSGTARGCHRPRGEGTTHAAGGGG
eukprot:291383-Prorocentrum_minimum.AAC.2